MLDVTDTLEIVVTDWAPTQLELVTPQQLARRTREMDADTMRAYALEYASREDAPTCDRTPTKPEAARSLASVAAEWDHMWSGAAR
jgi:hypothetical protein